MYDNGLNELVAISQAVGNSPDLIQGGGGNTSVKLNDKLMAVKASGYRLNQITKNEGFVVVNYEDIKKYYDNVDLSSDVDYEKDSVDFVKKSIVKMDGLKELRPSVEAGFHSILKKYVIHTHAVYANILCCVENGEELANTIFKDSNISYLWIPYINPGFSLTLKIKEEINNCISKGGKFPDAIFMANHGLIVNSDSNDECIKLHEIVNSTIKEYFDISNDYPEIKLYKAGENKYISKTKYVNDFIKENMVDVSYLEKIALYPDQLVYLNGNFSETCDGRKIEINSHNGEVTYNTTFQEANTIEETLLAYIFVIENIFKIGLSIKTMSFEEISFIRNWESERYRKSLVAK